MPSRIRPARRSTIIPSSSSVAQFPRKATSPGMIFMPQPIASINPLAIENLSGSYPRIAKVPITVVATVPDLTGSATPHCPSNASWSITGRFAACSGVLSPSSTIGRSPMPSNINSSRGILCTKKGQDLDVRVDFTCSCRVFMINCISVFVVSSKSSLSTTSISLFSLSEIQYS